MAPRRRQRQRTGAPRRAQGLPLTARRQPIGDRVERSVARRLVLVLADPVEVECGGVIHCAIGLVEFVTDQMRLRQVEVGSCVVGIAFDGNIESLPNDLINTEEAMRCVSVHSAGILEALDDIYKAERLVKELRAGKISD